MSNTAHVQGNSQGSSHSDSSPSRSSGSAGGSQDLLGDALRRLELTEAALPYLGKQLVLWFDDDDDLALTPAVFATLVDFARRKFSGPGSEA